MVNEGGKSGKPTSGAFRFDLDAKRNRLSEADLLAALQSAAESFRTGYFTTLQYDALPGRHPHSATIIERFGSWKKALAIIGITGGREREYSARELISNLEIIWKKLGYPPGKRQIAKLGQRISERPYKRHWGSVRAAAKALASYHEGRLTEVQLLAGRTENFARMPLRLKDRWDVLRRDNYRCVKCGATPSVDHRVELEVDHIVPVARGGRNSLDNLQTLCRNCNQGKSDK